MKIGVNITDLSGRYEAVISTPSFSALEEDKMRQFGEPLIEVGGSFSGSVARPGQTNTTVSLSGGGGTGATAVAVLDEFGGVVGYNVTNGGSGFSTPPAVSIAGDGTGATATAVLTADAVTSINVVTPGSGYHATPAAVSFVLPTAQIRMRADFPIKQVFDLADTLNADAQAKVFADTISARLTAAKNQLVERASPLEGETVVTV